MEKQVNWSKIDIILRNFERRFTSVIDIDWIWIWTLNSSFISHWIVSQLCCTHIIVWEWYRSHICERSPYLRCISCSRRKDQSADKQFWPLLPTTTGQPNYILCYWVVKSNLVIICLCISFDLFVIRNKKCKWMCYFFGCSNIDNIKLHLQHTKYIHIIW